jgi:hypothetical protein
MSTNYLLCFSLIIALSACSEKAPENRELIDQLDSLKTELRMLTKQLAKQNQQSDSTVKQVIKPTTQPAKKEKLQEPEKEHKKDNHKTDPPKVPDLPHPPTTNPISEHLKKRGAISENDTIKHFYSNKKIAVIITPFKDGRRNYLLYDQNGNLAFEMEAIRLSFSQSIDLKFHENGAVRLAKINFNPGASMYWYETEITFDENNYPLKKIEKQMPPSSAIDDLDNRYFWNKNERKWIKQEIIREYNTPNGPIDINKSR